MTDMSNYTSVEVFVPLGEGKYAQCIGYVKVPVTSITWDASELAVRFAELDDGLQPIPGSPNGMIHRYDRKDV
jgi:hypothetical protein